MKAPARQIPLRDNAAPFNPTQRPTKLKTKPPVDVHNSKAKQMKIKPRKKQVGGRGRRSVRKGSSLNWNFFSAKEVGRIYL